MKIRKDDILVWEDGGAKGYYLNPNFPDFEETSPEAAYKNGFYFSYLPTDSKYWVILSTFEMWNSPTRPALKTRWYKSRHIQVKSCKKIWAWGL